MSVILGIFGLAVGSFLNVCIDRLPQGWSLISPPSHCDSCQRRLAVWDLVPVLSYIWLRGKCRYCSATVSIRLPAVELFTGLVFAYIGHRYGLSLQGLSLLIYSSILIVVFFVDLERGLILDRVVYPGMALALVFPFFLPEPGVLGSLLGGALAFLLVLVIYLGSRGGMGGGDVKLAGFIGLATGFPLVLVALVLSFISGGLMASFLLLTRRRERKDAIPFGPFLSGTALVMLFWGTSLLEWYLSLFR
ncbi:MAG: prepilin peptidase [Chloroflexi bacterium]|nr:prepilin peptidase [Chloroflexota bacterium]